MAEPSEANKARAESIIAILGCHYNAAHPGERASLDVARVVAEAREEVRREELRACWGVAVSEMNSWRESVRSGSPAYNSARFVSEAIADRGPMSEEKA